MHGSEARLRGLIVIMLGAWLPSWACSETLPSISLKTFDEVWQTVNESYHDPEFGGLDWTAIGAKYRERAEQASSADSLRPILNEMLGELGESHFGVIPSSHDLEESALIEDSTDNAPQPDEQEVTDPAPDDEPQEALAPAGDYSGVHLRLALDQLIVSAVDVDSPAAKAGVKAGMTVSKIGKLDVATFLKKAADEVPKSFSHDFFILSVLGELTGVTDDAHQSLTVSEPNKRREQTFRYRPVRYPGKMSVEFANMPSMPLRFEQRRIAVPQGDVLYLAFNIFLPDIMPELRSAIREAEDDVVGMIIDLRGNPGGVGVMANGLAGMLTDKQFSLGQMMMRAGHINFVAFPQKKAFLGPVAILVDRMSASTAEIFAAGLQEAGRAKVFGRRTMGAALPSFIRDLPNGDRLQHAIADFTTAQERRVEGRGVIPDHTVELRPKRLLRGIDPDLERALKWLKRISRKATS